MALYLDAMACWGVAYTEAEKGCFADCCNSRGLYAQHSFLAADDTDSDYCKPYSQIALGQ